MKTNTNSLTSNQDINELVIHLFAESDNGSDDSASVDSADSDSVDSDDSADSDDYADSADSADSDDSDDSDDSADSADSDSSTESTESDLERMNYSLTYSFDFDKVKFNDNIGEDKCPICMDEFEDNPEQNIIQTICAHKFHESCINEWFEISNEIKNCPYCRRDFSNEIQLNSLEENDIYSKIPIETYSTINNLELSSHDNIHFYCDECQYKIPEFRYNLINNNYDLCIDCWNKISPDEHSKYQKSNSITSMIKLDLLPKNISTLKLNDIALHDDINISSYLYINSSVISNIIINKTDEEQPSNIIKSEPLLLESKNIDVYFSEIIGDVKFKCDSLKMEYIKLYTTSQIQSLFNSISNITSLDIDISFYENFNHTLFESSYFNFPTIFNNLKKLEINFNTRNKNCVKIIDADFDFGDSLEYLKLNGIKFKKMFKLPKTLKELHLNSSICNTIDHIDFEGYDNLESVILYNLYINTISNLGPSINFLSVTKCRLKNISNMPINAEHILLNNNLLDIKNIDYLVSNLKKVSMLNLSNNKLKSAYIPLTISSINYENNLIENLILQDPSSLPDDEIILENIYCSNNRIIELPKFPSSVTNVYFSNNKLKGSVTIGSNIINLEINDNLITDLVFESGDNIKQLNCYNNLIKTISVPNNTFTELSMLNCYKNKLTDLPHITTNYIEYINCANNKLINIPKFESNISYLNCSYNKLKTFEQKRVDILNCSQNLLETFTIENCRNLNCAFNQLNKLNIINKKKIHNLNCSNNKFNNFDKEILPIRLDCSYNPLSDILKLNKQIISLNISNTNIEHLIADAIPEGLVHYKCRYTPNLKTTSCKLSDYENEKNTESESGSESESESNENSFHYILFMDIDQNSKENDSKYNGSNNLSYSLADSESESDSVQ